MADQLNTTTSLATGPGLSSITSTVQGGLTTLTSKSKSILDRIIPPSTRESVKNKLMTFAAEKPLLASFLLGQIALSGLPLALFIIMSLTVVIFALLTGIIVGVLGALVFIVFAVGFALLILLPTLFVTTFFACAVWLWGVGAYYLLKWFNEKSVPGLHKPLGEGLKEKIGLGGVSGLNGVNGQAKGNGHVGEKNGVEKRDMKDPATAKGPHRVNENEVQSHQADESKKSTHQRKQKMVDDEQPTKKVSTKKITDAGDGVANVGKSVTSVVV